jgi:hypothetical protein
MHDDVSHLQEAEQRARGAQQEVLAVRYDANQGSVAVVRARVQAQPGYVVDASGKNVRALSGDKPVEFLFSVSRENGSWLIRSAMNLGPSRGADR